MSGSAYDRLASVYDQLQVDVDNSAWADFISQLDRDFNRRTKEGDGENGSPLLLDLGCGTGEMCLEMARRGYDPIGIDSSPSMLETAREKWQSADLKDVQALFLLQDISSFELYGTVDLIVCLLDTINHLVRPGQVRGLFHLCANYLNPGGLFIFDALNYEYISQTLGNNFFYQDKADFTLFWQNHFNQRSKISRSELTFFLKQNDGSYRRDDELIKEKYYAPEDIITWLKDLPLTVIDRCAPLRRSPPDEKLDRQVYIIRKNNQNQEKIKNV